MSSSNMANVKACLWANPTTLKDLDIGFVNPGMSMSLGKSNGEKGSDCEELGFESLSLQKSSGRITLPCLKHLSLSNARFDDFTKAFTDALNFAALRSLKLWNCTGVGGLLTALTRRKQPFPLTSFELVASEQLIEVDDSVGDIAVALPAFLEKLESVQDLCLMLRERIAWADVGPAIGSRLSLRQLVVHKHWFSNDNNTLHGKVSDDYVNVGPWFANMMEERSLECLGISYRPANLVRASLCCTHAYHQYN